MVYFVKAGDYIKIGYSKNEKAFKTRLSSYKTSCPFEVEVLGTLDGGVEEERNIMNYFIKWLNDYNLMSDEITTTFE